jgi:hypothetical protein
MALNTASADALASSIVTALGLTGDPATQALVHWKAVTRSFYAALVTDVIVNAGVVTSVAGVTPGGGVSGPGATIPGTIS